MHIYVYMYVYTAAIKQKEAMNLKDSSVCQGWYMGGLEAGKGRGNDVVIL